MPRTPSGQAIDVDPKRGVACSAVFVARNRFAITEKGKVLIKDMNNATTREFQPTGLDGKVVKPTDIFFAGGKNIISMSLS